MKNLVRRDPRFEDLFDLRREFDKIFVSLPGIEPKEVQIHVQGNPLTITGDRKYTRTTKEPKVLHEEFAHGKFERTLELPEGVNPEKMIVNGMLALTAPVAVTALPRKIEIKTIPMTKQIAA